MKYVNLTFLLMIGCGTEVRDSKNLRQNMVIDTVKTKGVNFVSGKLNTRPCFYYSYDSLKGIIYSMKQDTQYLDSFRARKFFSPVANARKRIIDAKIVRRNLGFYFLLVRMEYKNHVNIIGPGTFTILTLLNKDLKPVASGLSSDFTNNLEEETEYTDIWGDTVLLEKAGIKVFTDTFIYL